MKLGIRRSSFFALAAVCMSSAARAVILVGGGNGLNTSNPGYNVPWDQVARVTNSGGTHKSSGSAVYLGGGYMLTANHVDLSQGFVSFDGSTTFAIQSGSAKQVQTGVDLKVFQLATTPGFSGVSLLPESSYGAEFGNPYYEFLVGWGVGHDPADTGNPWNWGPASTTSTKRWGLNNADAWTTLNYGSYSFEALVTVLGSAQTGNEAAVTLYDSGSALFFSDDATNWYLAGVPVTVENDNISTFGTETLDTSDATRGDFNFFARVSAYADEIGALMTDPLIIPEPEGFGLLAGAAGVLAAAGMRRRR